MIMCSKKLCAHEKMCFSRASYDVSRSGLELRAS